MDRGNYLFAKGIQRSGGKGDASLGSLKEEVEMLEKVPTKGQGTIFKQES